MFIAYLSILARIISFVNSFPLFLELGRGKMKLLCLISLDFAKIARHNRNDNVQLD